MTCVVVLGPHRSGTSLVAGILNSLGVNMGERFRTADEFNPTGYYEDLDFKVLNQRLLKKAGGTWHEPPSQHAIHTAWKSLDGDVYALLNRKSQCQLWGWKDPRQCLVMDWYLHWLHTLDGDVRFVVVNRSLDGTVDSLVTRETIKARRTEVPRVYWRLLTMYYRVLAEAYAMGHNGIVVEYDLLCSDKHIASVIVGDLARSVGIYPTDTLVEEAIGMIKWRV